METSPPSSTPRSCFTCRKVQFELTEPLKRCGKCLNTSYCSQACQKADWKSHKHVCGQSTGVQDPSTSHPESNTSDTSARLMLGLDGDLSSLSQADVFCALVDCFRMRVEDMYTFQGVNMGILNDHSRCVPDFKRFLDLAESRRELLPKWWNAAKRSECEAFSVRAMMGEYKYHGHAEANIFVFTDKGAIQNHYGDNMMPIKLRLLAESIYGTGVM